MPGAAGYDVVEGDLGLLRASSGDFAQATTACLANDVAGTSWSHGADPGAGEGRWYLWRPVMSSGPGSYDSADAGLAASRDAGVEAAASTCP